MLAAHEPRPGLIHRSDRGCQYGETTYRALLPAVHPPDRRHANFAVFDHIEIFANGARRLSSPGWRPVV